MDKEPRTVEERLEEIIETLVLLLENSDQAVEIRDHNLIGTMSKFVDLFDILTDAQRMEYIRRTKFDRVIDRDICNVRGMLTNTEHVRWGDVVTYGIDTEKNKLLSNLGLSIKEIIAEYFFPEIE
ncbi:MAG: hypothetical protein WCT46_02090 [Candidatus Gracilibacteria bacterium]|jgi:hypothetical protein